MRTKTRRKKETVARLQSLPLTVQLSFVAKSLENPNLTSESVTTVGRKLRLANLGLHKSL